MSTDQDPITDFDLIAYADGKLEPSRAERVRLHIAGHPDAAARLEAYLAQNRDLHAAYGALAQEEVPPRLHGALAARPGRGQALVAARAAAIAALIVAGAVSGWMIGRSSQASDFGAQAFGRDAARTHMEAATPQTAAAQSGDAAALSWLRQRISLELKAPDLSREGYTLVGRHKAELNKQPAVQLVYQGEGGARLSIFLRRRWRETRPQVLTTGEDGRTVAYWLDGPVAYGVTGDADKDRLIAIARKVNKAISIEPKVVPRKVEELQGTDPSIAEADGVRRGS